MRCPIERRTQGLWDPWRTATQKGVSFFFVLFVDPEWPGVYGPWWLGWTGPLDWPLDPYCCTTSGDHT